MPNNEGGGTEIPQPLIVTLTQYKSKEALIADLAMKLYVNETFSDASGRQRNAAQIVKDVIVRAQTFVDGAGSLIDDLIGE